MPVRSLQVLKAAYSHLGILVLILVMTQWTQAWVKIPCYHLNPMYTALSGNLMTLYPGVSMSARTQYLTVLESSEYFSFLSTHLAGEMVVGPSREDKCNHHYMFLPECCRILIHCNGRGVHLFPIKWILGPSTGSYLELGKNADYHHME